MVLLSSINRLTNINILSLSRIYSQIVFLHEQRNERVVGEEQIRFLVDIHLGCFGVSEKVLDYVERTLPRQ